MADNSLQLIYHVENPHGGGQIGVCWQRGATASLLATTGLDNTVAIFDRHGHPIHRIKLSGLCYGMEWDSDGDLLAIITNNESSIIIWECHQQKRLTVETGLRELPTCIAWAKKEPIIAIGTMKGNISLYNHQTSKRIPVLGKHSKRIICGAWNSDNILALVAEDKTLSISNSEGDTLRVVSLRDQPNDIQFSEMKTDERVAGENTISLVIGRRTLYLYNLLNPENPIELAFQQKYGLIVSYKWFGDGYILIGFSSGILIAISTHIKEVGQELFQVKNHKDSMVNIAVSNILGEVATCGDSMLKIRSVWDTTEVSVSFYPQGGAESCAWSNDGQLLAVAGRSSLSVYLSKLAPLCSSFNTRAFLLTNLTEGTLFQCASTVDTSNFTVKGGIVELMKINLNVEPLLLAVGPYHIAYASNDVAWFYDTTIQFSANVQPSKQQSHTTQRQYPGIVKDIQLGPDYVSVLFEGKVLLHMIDHPDVSREDKESLLFPEPAIQEALITSHSVTNDFFVFVTDLGHLQYFALEEWKTVARYRHPIGLNQIYCDPPATRCVIVDIKNIGFVYSPISDNITEIPDFPQNYKHVLWDTSLSDRNVFIVATEENILTYYFVNQSVNGRYVEMLGSTPLTKGHTPLVLFNGDVYLHINGGKINKITLSTHEKTVITTRDDADEEKQLKQLKKLIGLRRYNEAWNFCKIINKENFWIELGEAAIANLDIAFAIRVYTELSDAAMVWSLEDMLDIENISILCARSCVCLGRAEAASAWGVGKKNSVGNSEEELSLRLALRQWARAVELARTVAPHKMPSIQLNYAQHLEFTGDYHEALNNYEKSIIPVNNPNMSYSETTEEHNKKSLAGISRMAIRCGDFSRAMTILSNLSENTELVKECAVLLENSKQYGQAAALFEQIGSTDKAVILYMKLKSWIKVEMLLPKVTIPKIHLQYAKFKESEGKYNEALRAYKMGKDFDSAIRLNLEHFNNSDEAVQLVQETKSIIGAKMVASFFQKLNDYVSAIRFLIMSQCYDEAFQLARQHGKLQLFGEILIQNSDSKTDSFKSLALHFESEKNNLLAGKFFFHAKEYSKANSHLLKAATNNDNENEALSIAIDSVASSESDVLSKQLIDYLLGDVDGIPKDPKYLFRLYMARKQFQEAAKTAIIIANQEQMGGNYRVAHDMLFNMYQELKNNNLNIPHEMKNSLMILHSYILVRLHLKRGDHYRCAIMLIRVAENISLFPSHIVSILTSTVIECQRAGLKKATHNYAKLLMKSEYRSQIDPKYIKKIESAVRHPPKESEMALQEQITECPYCDSNLPETSLTCAHCQMALPFCIATGCHIIKSDLTACPECDFPAIMKEFSSLLSEGLPCPMCWEKVDPKRLIRIQNVQSYLSKYERKLN